jgi:lipopolysaccharide export system ATP-binding protein
VEIARSLAINPAFILLDEPFAGIDPIAVLDIQRIVSQLRSRGIGILITDHNVRETLKITDRAYIIKEGEIFRQGAPEELSATPKFGGSIWARRSTSTKTVRAPPEIP